MYAEGYWYRDDALVLWDAIWNFVDELLLIYYEDEAEVRDDVELAAMLKELKENSTSKEV